MHSNGLFLKDVAGFLGFYYTFLALMNAVAALILWQKKKQTGWAIVWSVFASVMMVLAGLALSGSKSLVPSLPLAARSLVNTLSGPMLYTLGTTALFTILFVFRKFFVQPMVAWTVFNAALVLMGLSMADENFAAIVMKPDNVPIVGLVFLLAFFTWVATKQAVVNDERIARGLPPMGIGEGTIIEGAIVDKNVRIGTRTRIVNDHGWDEIGDSTTFTVRDGVAIVPKDAIVPDGWRPDPTLHRGA